MASERNGKVVRIVLITVGAIVLASAGGVSALAARYDPLVAPGVSVDGVALGGLTRASASDKLAAWWRDESSKEIHFTAPGLEARPQGFSNASLGVTLNLDKTVAQLPLEDFWQNTARKFSSQAPASKSVSPVFKVDRDRLKPLAEFVRERQKPYQPARADFEEGEIVKTPEQSHLELDEDALAQRLPELGDTSDTELPLRKAQQRVSDEDLAKISEVVSSFTTRYSEGNANRAANIQNAARRLSGTIVMPGETFSFNKTLGRRTAENGFKLAGVYNNGKHDFDIGGGICQVSGTLYNATLLANLQIVVRSCHTFPVPYLPVGRDATVSYPAPDFAFKNNLKTPVAVAAQAGGGSITFRILGVKDPGLEVKVETAGHETWSHPEKVIKDPTLPPGKKVVDEPGGAGHRVTTYRIVYKDGRQVERENLGTSIYKGGSRVVRMNPATSPTGATTVTNRPVDDERPDEASGGTVPPRALETPNHHRF